jgi:hypothetical protein
MVIYLFSINVGPAVSSTRRLRPSYPVTIWFFDKKIVTGPSKLQTGGDKPSLFFIKKISSFLKKQTLSFSPQFFEILIL